MCKREREREMAFQDLKQALEIPWVRGSPQTQLHEQGRAALLSTSVSMLLGRSIRTLTLSYCMQHLAAENFSTDAALEDMCLNVLRAAREHAFQVFRCLRGLSFFPCQGKDVVPRRKDFSKGSTHSSSNASNTRCFAILCAAF